MPALASATLLIVPPHATEAPSDIAHADKRPSLLMGPHSYCAIPRHRQRGQAAEPS